MGSDARSQKSAQRAAQIVLHQLSQGVRFHACSESSGVLIGASGLPCALLSATLQQVQGQLIKAT